MTCVRALVLAGFGINCEEESAAAYRLAGAEVSVAHLGSVLRSEVDPARFDVVHLPGGFSFGDDLGAGKALANRMRTRRIPGGGTIFDGLVEVTRGGGMVVGICNGFQVLVHLGLVPNLGGRCEPEASLLVNASGRYEDRWVLLRANERSPVRLWSSDRPMEAPVRHGQGRLAFRTAAVRNEVRRRGLDLFAYCDAGGHPTDVYPENPNASELACAALCDPEGGVMGMMPHPEAFLSAFVHPDWPRRRREGDSTEEGDGLAVFRAVVDRVALRKGIPLPGRRESKEERER